MRHFPEGFIWDVAGSGAFPHGQSLMLPILGNLCSNSCAYLLTAINPTLNLQVENILAVPLAPLSEISIDECSVNVDAKIWKSKRDWDSYETSWDFTSLPLLRPQHRSKTLAATYASLRQRWQSNTLEMQKLEKENNRIFIDAYGLAEELSPEVPLREITLTCNPHYRYPGTQRKTYTQAERESLLLADTMKEFISYAAGCMFGRYSLDKPGLVLANAGETVDDYLAVIASPRTLFRGEAIPRGRRGDCFVARKRSSQ